MELGLMDSNQIKNTADNYIIPSYNRIPLSLIKGKGAYLWDVNNKKYLDFVSGLAVTNLGHCHPEVVKAAQEQAKRLFHTSNLYYTEPQTRLAEVLSKNSLGGKVFFCNSGAEANEAAIKLARKFGRGSRYEIITMKNSFHGRTIATITATGQSKFQNGFEPLIPGFRYVQLNDLEQVSSSITPATVAIMVEPIQGEGGVNIASLEYLERLREICNQHQILLIFDEVQTGIGRTGKLFAYQHTRIEPDIMTLAKALGNGLPIGAMVTRPEIANILSPGTHASTFGGNPIACAVALTVMKVITQKDLLEHVRQMGDYLFEKLSNLKIKYPFIKDIRGKGLMIGIELDLEGTKIVSECQNLGLLINCTMTSVLRLLPPLTITICEIDKALEILEKVFILKHKSMS